MFSNDLLNGIYLMTFVMVFTKGIKLSTPKDGAKEKIAILLAIIAKFIILNLGTYGIYLVITSLSQYFLK